MYAFNEVEKLTDGTVPFEIWLKNAVIHSAEHPEEKVFEEYLHKLQTKALTESNEQASPREAIQDTSRFSYKNQQGGRTVTNNLPPLYELKGEQKRQLREALITAYPDVSGMKKMVSDRLSQNLNVIVNSSQGLDDVAFELVNWAEANGYMQELIDGAIASNPRNPKLMAFSEEIGLTGSAPVGKVTTPGQASNLEKIVSRNDAFIDMVKWRTELTKMERRVCRIDYKGSAKGTGFLIGPDAILTNHHVVSHIIDAPQKAKHITCRFDYITDESGNTPAGTILELADDWLIDSSPHSPVDLEKDPKSRQPTDDELDFAILRLKTPVDETRGWITLSDDEFDLSEQKFLSILQHSDGDPLKLSMGMGQIVEPNAAKNRVRYTVPTLGGSSGSPVFTGKWELLALHHSGDPTKVNPTYNEGIPVNKIASRQEVKAYLNGLNNV